MNGLIDKLINCPYCGETFTVFVDTSVSHQRYIEDCQICCCPINFAVAVVGEDDVVVNVISDNE